MNTFSHQDTLFYHQIFDLGKWSLESEQAHYCYQRLSEFFPHAWIHRAGPLATLQEEPLPGIEEIKATTSLGELTLKDYMEKAAVDGWLVIRGGKIIYERYLRMRPFDKHIWWSVTKSLVGTLVAILEDDGQVDTAQPIERYIEELADSDWRGTLLIDILDMAAGMAGRDLDEEDSYTNPESRVGLYESSLGMVPRTPKTFVSTYQYIASLPRLKPSGQAFEYSSPCTFVCGWLAERVSNQSFAELASERIWRRMGAESDALILISPVGAPGTHGMLSSTLRDLGRYGLLFTPSWSVVSSEKIISDAYLTRIQGSGRPEIYMKGACGQSIAAALGEQPHHNTYQWDMVMADGDFYKGGYGGQGLYISPGRDLVIAYFSSGVGRESLDTLAFARAIAKSNLITKQ